MVVLGVIGARIAHVATMWSLYSAHPSQIFAVWQGGLSSFGGLALAAPVGFVLARKWWPESRAVELADAIVPVLVAAWAMGRVLGPQFMVNGGGHVTHQWFGLRYAGQMGKRVPVPLIQGFEDGTLWAVLIWLERRGLKKRRGAITGIALVVWGVVRTLDERFLLGQQGHTGSVGVQIAGLALALIGLVVLVFSVKAPREAVSN